MTQNPQKNPHLPSEEEILEILDTVVKIVAPKYVFGYYTVEDIEQEARIIALGVLPKYNGTTKLSTFLHTCLKNRLSNLKRDKFERLTSPCARCTKEDCNALECVKLARWRRLNTSKKGLMSPLVFDASREEEGQAAEMEFQIESELIAILDRFIPSELRQDYVRAKTGAKLSKNRKDKLKEAIEQILTEQEFDWETN